MSRARGSRSAKRWHRRSWYNAPYLNFIGKVNYASLAGDIGQKCRGRSKPLPYGLYPTFIVGTLIDRLLRWMIHQGFRTTDETPLLGEMGEAQRGGPFPARNVSTVVRYASLAGDIGQKCRGRSKPLPYGLYPTFIVGTLIDRLLRWMIHQGFRATDRRPYGSEICFACRHHKI